MAPIQSVLLHQQWNSISVQSRKRKNNLGVQNAIL
jgi:hypothetical protein